MEWNYPHMALIFAPWYTKVRKTLELYILKERAYSLDITDDYQNIYEAFHDLKDMFNEMVNEVDTHANLPNDQNPQHYNKTAAWAHLEIAKTVVVSLQHILMHPITYIAIRPKEYSMDKVYHKH